MLYNPHATTTSRINSILFYVDFDTIIIESVDPAEQQAQLGAGVSVTSTSNSLVMSTTGIIVLVQFVLFGFLLWRFRIMQRAFTMKLESALTKQASKIPVTHAFLHMDKTCLQTQQVALAGLVVDKQAGTSSVQYI